MILTSSFSFGQNISSSNYASVISIEELQKHLTIIASDEMEGRETGTPGQRKASAYIENQFKSIGLQAPKQLNGYQQFFSLNQDTALKDSLTINGEIKQYGIDYIGNVTLNSTGVFASDSIVFVGYGIEDDAYNDYINKNVTGKVVVFVSGEPKKGKKYLINPTGKKSDWTSSGLSKKMELAKLKGAVGAIYINLLQDNFSETIIKKSLFSDLNYVDNQEVSQKVNCISISHSLATKILGDQFDDYLDAANKGNLLNEITVEKAAKIEYLFAKKTKNILASNVIGIIEGTDKKNEYVVLSAHYDHLGKKNGVVYNGADDDGSGTVAVIEMASAFAKAKKEGHGPRRTIVFMTVSGEEKGLWGSEYYSNHPVFSLENTSVDLNTDMIGRIDTERKLSDTLNYVYVVGHDKLSSELPIINEEANKQHTKLTLDYKFDDPEDPNRIYYRSDHYNFARKGVPVLFFYDGMLLADYHQPTDDVEKINWPLYQKRAQMIFHTAWEIANRDEMLIRDKPLPVGNR